MATVTTSTCASPLGRMVAVKFGSVAPLSVIMQQQDLRTGKWHDVSLQSLGLCTRLEVNQSVIAQFQNTFGSFVYITPFGDKPGDIRITFITNSLCDKSADALGAIDFYVKNRLMPTQLVGGPGAYVVQQKTAPITVAIVTLTLYGFITGLDINGSTEGSAIVVTRLSMTGWPK